MAFRKVRKMTSRNSDVSLSLDLGQSWLSFLTCGITQRWRNGGAISIDCFRKIVRVAEIIRATELLVSKHFHCVQTLTLCYLLSHVKMCRGNVKPQDRSFACQNHVFCLISMRKVTLALLFSQERWLTRRLDYSCMCHSLLTHHPRGVASQSESFECAIEGEVGQRSH
jgi:hypothetical protein